MKIKSKIKKIKLNVFGYVVLPEIGNRTLNSLFSFYKENIHFQAGTYNSVLNDDIEIRIQHHEFILKELTEYLDNVFYSYKAFVATYFCNKKGVSVGPHQGPSSIDYRKFNDYTIWIPLVDTSKLGTGRLKVRSFSHKKYSQINFVQSNFSFNYLKQFNKKLRAVSVSAGQPILFNNKLIHSSEVNETYETRPAIAIRITLNEAQLVSYHVLNWDEGVVDMYLQNDSYYLKYLWDEKKKPTEGKYLDTIKLEFD